MTRPRQRWRFLIPLLGLLLCAGCNMMSWPYFLGMGDNNLPPQLMELAPEGKGKDKDKVAKVVILAYGGTLTQMEFITADRDLTGMLTNYLKKAFKENKDKIEVVAPGKVNRYKDTHPNWHLDLNAAGKYFDADYLIYLDIESLNLYEKGSRNLLYRGRADIHVSVIDMHNPDDAPAVKDYHAEFPPGAPVPCEDRNPLEFRRAFLDDTARHLSWYFTRHSPGDEYGLPQ